MNTNKYTPKYFIDKFTAIPDDKWIVGALYDGTGRYCALGHCGVKNREELTDYDIDKLLKIAVKYFTGNGKELRCLDDILFSGDGYAYTEEGLALESMFKNYLNTSVPAINDGNLSLGTSPKARMLNILNKIDAKIAVEKVDEIKNEATPITEQEDSDEERLEQTT